jgi:1-acyl-sn-glycerol-3-phosphate acyltransferase
MFILIQIKALLLSLLLLIFVLLPTCLIAMPFALNRRLKIVCPVWAFCARVLLRYACHCRIDIQEDHRSAEYAQVPAYGLYVANHQSFIDIPLIITMFQVPPIMKKEVLYIPIFGWLGWVSGAMPVSRSKYNSRKKVFAQTRRRILNDRIGVQVYPEGTRSKDALPKTVALVKRTLFVFAYNEKIPVIPTSIYGTRGVLSPKGVINTGRHVGIIVHKEILPSDYTNAEDFTKACWEQVIQGHDEMKSKLGPLNEN